MTRGSPNRFASRDRAALAAVLLVVPTGAVACSFGMPRGATEQAEDTFDLWQIFMWAAVAVSVIVYGLIVWSIVRYRERRNDASGTLGRQFHSNLPIEIVYTASPIVLAAALFVMSTLTQGRVEERGREVATTVRTVAFAWGWRFHYEEADVTVLSDPSGPEAPIPEIVLPLGERVRFVLTSDDVIHAFWVPDFLFKRDAIPGHVNEFELTPSRLGVFPAACSEFCGLNHAYMRFTVRVVAPGEFRAWLEERAEAA